MMSKMLITALMISLQFIGLEAQEIYTDAQRTAFAEIYLAQKELISTAPGAIALPLDKYKVSAARYGEIFTAQVEKKEINLNENEQALVAFIAQQNAERQLSKAEMLSKNCRRFDLPKATYLAMLKRFQSEIKFQRSFKPQFDAILEKQKG